MIGASQSEIYSGKLFELLNDCNPVKCLENHRGKYCFPSYHTCKMRVLIFFIHDLSNNPIQAYHMSRPSNLRQSCLQQTMCGQKK